MPPMSGQVTGPIVTLDPSARAKHETAYALIKYLHGRLFLPDCGGFRDGYSEAGPRKDRPGL
jgi:hypothetical protein